VDYDAEQKTKTKINATNKHKTTKQRQQKKQKTKQNKKIAWPLKSRLSLDQGKLAQGCPEYEGF